MWILSGTIQGGPVSGSIFAMCIDPILRRLIRCLVKEVKGIRRACADDVGFTLFRLSTLKDLTPIYAAAKHSHRSDPQD